MSYLVFARKYRPQKFEDVVAQDHVTRTLQNGIRNDRTGSGYLFCGPRGTGKTTMARLLAKAINCINGPTPEPCGECPACIEIAKGSSLDVLEIDAASNTGVDDVRTLRENVRYLPTSGKKRIYIIDEVHRLSGPAFDALLKTLEEPPPHVLFIFATTEPLKVPETILSRTQRFDFKRVSVSDLGKNLRKIATAENMDIDETALQLIARKADGSVRDSLSLLDQIAAYASDHVTEKEVIEALGLVDRSLLFDYTTAVASKDTKRALVLVRNVIEGGIDPKDFVSELLEHLRILMILATDKDSADLLSLPEDDLKAYLGQADYFAVGDVVRLMKMAGDLNADIKDSGLDERLLLELTAVKMAEMEATVKFEEILQLLKSGGAAGGGTDLFGLPQKKKSDSPAERMTLVRSQPEDNAPGTVVMPTVARTVNVAMLQAGWDGFLSVLRGKRPMLASQLGVAEITGLKDNRVILSFPRSAENSKQIIEKSENIGIITEILREHFRTNIGITFNVDPNKEAPKESAENGNGALEIKKTMENSPRIKMLLEKVEGQIIGVKKVK